MLKSRTRAGYRVVNFSKTPHVPKNLIYDPSIQIESLIKRGRVRIGSKEDVQKIISLYTDEAQREERIISGDKLIDLLKRCPLLPVILGDFLEDNPSFVPDLMKKGRIYFWTLYCDESGDLYVRGFHWNGIRLVSNYYNIGIYWANYEPAAICLPF